MEQYLILISIMVLGPFVGAFLGIVRKPGIRLTRYMLAFAAGVMLTISCAELLPESLHYATWVTVVLGAAFGFLVIYLAEKLLPHIHPSLTGDTRTGKNIEKATFLLVIGITLHNLPEGMAIGMSAVSGLHISLLIALAIAIHDIPETICISAPYYYLTHNRGKAFWLAMATALPSLLGFLITYHSKDLIPALFIGLLLAVTAGFMVYISLHVLVPASLGRRQYKAGSLMSFVAGCIMVALLMLTGV